MRCSSGPKTRCTVARYISHHDVKGGALVHSVKQGDSDRVGRARSGSGRPRTGSGWPRSITGMGQGLAEARLRRPAGKRRTSFRAESADLIRQYIGNTIRRWFIQRDVVGPQPMKSTDEVCRLETYRRSPAQRSRRALRSALGRLDETGAGAPRAARREAHTPALLQWQQRQVSCVARPRQPRARAARRVARPGRSARARWISRTETTGSLGWGRTGPAAS